MPIDFEYILLLIVAFFPVYYKFSFWLYVIQLKEYRFDRFKEYIFTKQGKNAYFNFWFLLEFPFFISCFFIFLDKNLEIIIFPTIFYFFLIQNIFVLGKIFRNKLLKPKNTSRLLLTKLIISLLIGIDLYYLIFGGYENLIMIYLFILILFTPIIIFISIFISLPIVNYLKNKKLNSAINKSLKINHPIKVGVTGSFGKSSVKEYLSSILENEGKLLKTPENINSELGVSEIVLNKLDNTYDYFVAEMGAYKIGEIEKLGEIVNHKYGFLTAIGNQHIGLFGSQENIINAKFEISKKVFDNKGVLYVNHDNENIQKLKYKKGLNIVKYGTTTGCDAIGKFIKIKGNNFVFNFKYKEINEEFETNLIGLHNILNLTGIIAFCIDIGIDIKNIKKNLLKLSTPKNTLTLTTKKVNNFIIKIINDTYNLSVDGLFAGINILRYFGKDYEKILIIDDILELGSDAKKIHYNIGARIANEKKIDKIILVGINYKTEFKKGLIDQGFDKNNILNNIKSINCNSVILLEGRNSGKFNLINK